MTNTVVWAHSDEPNAPVLNNAAGSLDALLHAMLVTGWALQTVSSVVVASGVATVTRAGHGYLTGRIVDHAGATPSALNGRKRITVLDANTYTFPAPGVPDGAATGTITAKRAALGWTRPYSSGNVSIYARSDVTATQMMLRINDSGSNGATAERARALMVWGVTDVNTFTERAPLDSTVPGGLFWNRGPNTAAAKRWVIVGDGRCFYLFTEYASYPSSSYSNVPAAPVFFGDLSSFRPGDAFAAAIVGNESTGFPGVGIERAISVGSTPTVDCHVARPSFGLGGPVRVAAVGPMTGESGGAGPLYPSPVDGGMVILSPVLASENSSTFNHPLRGVWPGLGNPLANIPPAALHLQVLTNLNGSGRDWLLVAYHRAGSYGHMAFDITGPW